MDHDSISIGSCKRDRVDQELLDALPRVFGSDVAYLVLNRTLSVRETTTPLEVFGFTSQSGTDMYFSYLGNSTKGIAFKFGFDRATTNFKVKGRAELFDHQYFLSGGIDFIVNQNSEDGSKLDT
jgi:hypothetical protein